MRRVAALILSLVMAVSGLPGCASSESRANEYSDAAASGSADRIAAIQTADLEFDDLSDSDLQRYVADAV